jgi:hypothetical protein
VFLPRALLFWTNSLGLYEVRREGPYNGLMLLPDPMDPLDGLGRRRVLELRLHEDLVERALKVNADAQSPNGANDDVWAAGDFELEAIGRSAHELTDVPQRC